MPYYGPSAGGGGGGSVRVATDFATINTASISINTANAWSTLALSECRVMAQAGDSALYSAAYLASNQGVEFNGDVAVVDADGEIIRRIVNSVRGTGGLYATYNMFDAKSAAIGFVVQEEDLVDGELIVRLAVRTGGERFIEISTELGAHFTLTVIGG